MVVIGQPGNKSLVWGKKFQVRKVGSRKFLIAWKVILIGRNLSDGDLKKTAESPDYGVTALLLSRFIELLAIRFGGWGLANTAALF